jgi:hypothetical protein
VFRDETFVANTSAWVVGCPAGSSGLSASMVASWGTGCMRVGCLGYMYGLDGCFSSRGDLTSGRLRRAFGRKFFSESLFGWHFVGVLSSSQTVDVNVGIRQLRANKLQRG